MLGLAFTFLRRTTSVCSRGTPTAEGAEARPGGGAASAGGATAGWGAFSGGERRRARRRVMGGAWGGVYEGNEHLPQILFEFDKSLFFFLE